MVNSITVPDVAQHQNPVPNAAVHGGFLCTSGILGKHPDAKGYPPDIETQAKLCFSYLVAILEAAEVTLQDVLKVDLHFRDKADRPAVNELWLKHWPDPCHRPARQAHVSVLPEGCRIQLVALAVLPRGTP